MTSAISCCRAGCRTMCGRWQQSLQTRGCMARPSGTSFSMGHQVTSLTLACILPFFMNPHHEPKCQEKRCRVAWHALEVTVDGLERKCLLGLYALYTWGLLHQNGSFLVKVCHPVCPVGSPTHCRV